MQKKFRSQFLEKHRQLKSAIHLCQHKAYSNDELFKYEDAEQTAKQCFLPLLIIRRQAQVMITNLEDELNDCMKQEDEEFTKKQGAAS